MGLFDTIQIYLKCPYCHNVIHEAQTKDLDESMRTYHAVSDFEIKLLNKKTRTEWDESFYNAFMKQRMNEGYYNVPKGFEKKKSVDVTIDCHSVSCQFDADRRDILGQGIPSGFGRIFTGDLTIKKGIFLSEVKNIKLDGHTEEYLSSYKKDKKNAKLLKAALPQYKNQEVIAVRNWGLIMPRKFSNNKKSEGV